MTIVLSCLELSSLIYNGTNVLEKFSLIKSYEENSFHPKFLISKSQDDIFIVIRGESSFVDIETMIDFMPVNINLSSTILKNLKQQNSDIFVTSSVFKSAQNIIQKVQQDISNCKGKIIFTGHSYGGSVAAMAAMLIRLNGTNRNSTNEKIKTDYHLRTFAITFGAYPCISPILSNITRKFVTGFVVNHDVFPSMNPKNINNILDSIVQRGTSQAKSGAARVTMMFAQLAQYFVNQSRNNKFDIGRKSLEMTLKLIKIAPKASKIKIINAGMVYHIFDDLDLSTQGQNKKESGFFKKLFKVNDDYSTIDQFGTRSEAEISQFDEDIEYESLIELLSGISHHYINSYRNVIKKSRNMKYPYYY